LASVGNNYTLLAQPCSHTTVGVHKENGGSNKYSLKISFCVLYFQLNALTTSIGQLLSLNM